MTGPGPVRLVGESRGGTVVLAAACGQPARVASVHLSNAFQKGSALREQDSRRAATRIEGARLPERKAA
jgi:pimeloyl-ACP methyl ester carboxylesterase